MKDSLLIIHLSSSFPRQHLRGQLVPILHRSYFIFILMVHISESACSHSTAGIYKSNCDHIQPFSPLSSKKYMQLFMSLLWTPPLFYPYTYQLIWYLFFLFCLLFIPLTFPFFISPPSPQRPRPIFQYATSNSATRNCTLFVSLFQDHSSQHNTLDYLQFCRYCYLSGNLTILYDRSGNKNNKSIAIISRTNCSRIRTQLLTPDDMKIGLQLHTSTSSKI
jgi:hypothetical protein